MSSISNCSDLRLGLTALGVIACTCCSLPAQVPESDVVSVPEELMRPAVVNVTGAQPRLISEDDRWTAVPRYLDGGTLYRPSGSTGTELQVEVESAGIFVIAAIWIVEEGKTPAGAQLTKREQLEEWGFRKNSAMIQPSREGHARYYLVYWKAAQAGEQFTLRTSLTRTPEVIVPPQEGLARLIDAKEEPTPFAHRPIPRRDWDYEPIDGLDVVSTINHFFCVGWWTFRNGGLESELRHSKRLGVSFPISEHLPPEYDMEMTVTRLSGHGPLRVGILSSDTHGVVAIGGESGSGVEMIDGKTPNDTFQKGQFLRTNQKAWVHIKVRVTSIEVYVDGRQVVDFSGDIRRIGAAQDWASIHFHREPFLLINNAQFRFERIMFFPMRSGPDVQQWLKEKKFTYRKWTNNFGEGMPDYILKSFSNDQIILQPRHGEPIRERLNFMCEYDQKYVRERFGEGSATDDLSAETLAKAKAATVYIRSARCSTDVRNGVGFLIGKRGDIGYVLTMRSIVVYSYGPRSPAYCHGDIEVHFDYGLKTSRKLAGEVIYQGELPLPEEDFAILAVRDENLPEPIDIDDSVELTDDQVGYVVTHESWKRNDELPPQQRPAIVKKKPLSRHRDRRGWSHFIFQSTVKGARSGLVIDAKGKFLGIVVSANSWGRPANWVQRLIHQRIVNTRSDILDDSGKFHQAMVWGTWVSPGAPPRRASMLLAPVDSVGAVDENPDLKWEAMSADAKSFPMKFKEHQVGGEVAYDPNHRYYMQWRIDYEGGRTEFSRPHLLDAGGLKPWYTYITPVLRRPPKPAEPPEPATEFPPSESVDRSPVVTVRPHEYATATQLEFKPSAIQWSLDARSLFVLEKGGKLYKLSLPSFQITHELTIPSQECTEMVVTKAGLAVLLGDKHQVLVIHPDTLNVSRQIHMPDAKALAGSPVLSTAFVVGTPNELNVVDLTKGEVLRTYRRAHYQTQWMEPMQHGPPPPSEMHHIACTPDGRYLFACDEQRLYRFQIKRGDLLYESGTPIIARRPEKIAISPDSRTVALSGSGGNFQLPDHPVDFQQVYLFDIDRLSAPRLKFAGGTDAVAMHGSGKYIYAESRGNDISVFDDKGDVLFEFPLGLRDEGAGRLLPYPKGNRVLVATAESLTFVDMERPGKTVDLKALVDLQRDVVHGDWKLDGENIVGQFGQQPARLRIPFEPPKTYFIDIGLKNQAKGGSLVMGLVSGGRQFTAHIDLSKKLAGIHHLDGKPLGDNESTVEHQRGPIGNALPVFVRFEVSPTRVRAFVERTTLFDWRGDQNRIQTDAAWDVGDSGTLFIGGVNSSWRIDSITATVPQNN